MTQIPDGLKDVPTSWEDHIHFAQWLIHRRKPSVVVDLGVDFGYSSYCFSLPNVGHVYGIDSFEGDPMAGFRDTFEYVKQKRKELNLKNLTFIKGDFNVIAKQWDKSIDILHIDGYHTYKAVKNDYDTWSPFVKKDGVILFHDTEVDLPGFAVKHFFKELALPKFNFTFCHGLGVVSQDEFLIEAVREEFTK
jgi:predicted O-methyltransferase YrrM